jgi:hypothetical protein
MPADAFASAADMLRIVAEGEKETTSRFEKAGFKPALLPRVASARAWRYSNQWPSRTSATFERRIEKRVWFNADSLARPLHMQEAS